MSDEEVAVYVIGIILTLVICIGMWVVKLL